jgi:hypothetical protein
MIIVTSRAPPGLVQVSVGHVLAAIPIPRLPGVLFFAGGTRLAGQALAYVYYEDETGRRMRWAG